MDHKKVGLAKWWEERGYNSDPFIWPNAADINTELFPDIFQWWYIDPGMKADPKGLGPILTLEEVMRLETSEPVLIYAPAGGGKTFYRRWAVQQIEENGQRAVEIWNIREKLRTPQDVSAWVLAVCIYDAVCKKLQIPPYSSPPEDINHVFEQCDQTIRRYAQGLRCYVLIDDVAQLFGKRRSAAGRNARTLAAIVNLCTTVAGRSGGEPLALRVFIPEQLKEQIQRHLEKAHRRPREWTIAWRAEHCEAVIERRLDSRWKDGPGSGIDHLNRLFTDVARGEFNKWLRQQKDISPRCVVEVLDRLARYAYRRGVTTGLLDERLWAQFVKSGEPKGICTRDIRYPVSRPFFSWFKSLARRFVALSFRLHQRHATRKKVLPRLAGLLHGTISWLASAMDWIEALLLLSILLGSILFVAWCLIQSAQLDQPPDLWACLQRIWQLIRQYLPGGS